MRWELILIHSSLLRYSNVTYIPRIPLRQHATRSLQHTHTQGLSPATGTESATLHSVVIDSAAPPIDTVKDRLAYPAACATNIAFYISIYTQTARK